MKKFLTHALSLLLTIFTISVVLASCKAPHTPPSTESEGGTEVLTLESTTEETTPVEPIDEKADYSEKHSELIELSNSLANGVQCRFSNSTWSAFTVKNQSMSFEYRLNKKRDQFFSYLNNTQGNPYFEDSFDVFVKMDDGTTYYAVDSTTDAVINIFKFGYYYNEVRAEHQNFVSVDGKNRNALPNLTLARVFHAYSDKLHTVAQIAATDVTAGIASIGFVLEIPTKNVAKLIAQDANGTHDNIDEVDWSTAVAVAFDIKNVGILGYILPVEIGRAHV